MTPEENAWAIREAQWDGCEFPEWTLYNWHIPDFQKTTLFYHGDDDANVVRDLATQREPANIAMNRLQNKKQLQKVFGYSKGMYSEGSPNFAIQCHATVRHANRVKKVHVLNLIGCALDHPDQPDVHYQDTQEKVIRFQVRMWTLAAKACRHLGMSQIQLYNVGGGAFGGPQDFIPEIFLPAIQEVYTRGLFRGIRITGFDTDSMEFANDMIPNDLFSQDTDNTLFVNAWDPWSMVGNGNAQDRSLDGYWGRSSNVAVLCWPLSNPYMKMVAV